MTEGRKGQSRTAKLHVTKVQAAEALRMAAGVQTAAAQMLKISPASMTNLMRRWPDLRRVQEETREQMIDLAEGQLYKLIRDGNLGAIIFFLKCHGKKRGWIDKVIVVDGGANPLETAAQLVDLDLREFSTAELRQISAENKARNAAKDVVDVEGVARPPRTGDDT